MNKNCELSNQSFSVSEQDLKFYEKLGVPIPRLSPNERLRRRLAFRNERCLYKRSCDLCNKSIVSIYSADKTFPVYCGECWWSDKWDPSSYAKDIDFSRTFFSQFADLQRVVPRLYMFETNNENSNYTNGSAYNRNCYMTFVSDHNDDCHYCYSVFNSRSSLDLMNAKNCELCYDCVGCIDCYELFYSINCSNCRTSNFLHNCRSCADCTLCTNLRNKQYCFENKQLSKAEYFRKLEELKLKTRTGVSGARKRFNDLLINTLEPAYVGEMNDNVTGDSIFNSRNCLECYDSHDLEDCSYVIHGNSARDCRDCYVLVDGAELCVDSVGIIGVHNGGYNYSVWKGHDIWYCDLCSSSNNLFGCVGLRQKTRYILNKEYTESEYLKLYSKLVSHMRETGEYGEFFPITLSPFAYNETAAQEYFPLTNSQALDLGFKWHIDNEITALSKSNRLPDSIDEVTNEVTKQTLICEATDGPYRLSASEISFYRKNHIAPPDWSFGARHMRRLGMRNSRFLRNVKCNSCNLEIQTTVRDIWKRKIFCKDCYAKAVN